MTEIDWTALDADRAAGTQGPLWVSFHGACDDMTVEIGSDDRRIASCQLDFSERENIAITTDFHRFSRLPNLEAYALAARKKLEAAEFLVDRVREWEADNLTDENCRDWFGHISPALAAWDLAQRKTS